MKQLSATDRRTISLAGMFLLLLCGVAPVQGDLLPFKTIQNMCFTADPIIAGKHVGSGKVRVDHVFYVSVPTTETIKTIDSLSIPKHSKIINEIYVRGKDVPPITTKRLVVFLVESQDGKFEPIIEQIESNPGNASLHDFIAGFN